MTWFTALPWVHYLHLKQRECYHAARFEKESRYYVIRLSQDLFGEWVITLINGRIKSKLGQSRTLAFTNFNEGFKHFCALAKLRHQRGYRLQTIACDNHLTLHILPCLIGAQEKKEVGENKEPKNNNRSKPKNTKPTLLQNKESSNSSSIQLGFLF